MPRVGQSHLALKRKGPPTLVRRPFPCAGLCDEIGKTGRIVGEGLLQLGDSRGEVRSRVRRNKAVAAVQHRRRNALRQLGHQCARQLKPTWRWWLLRELNDGHRASLLTE